MNESIDEAEILSSCSKKHIKSRENDPSLSYTEYGSRNELLK
jgi:hypothetical protein